MGRFSGQTDQVMRTSVHGFHQSTRVYDPSTRCRIHGCYLFFYVYTAIFPSQCGADHIWIKQNLKIKSLLETSRYAVMAQIWIAICVYLLLAYFKFSSQIYKSFQQIIRLLQLNLFDHRDLRDLLGDGPPESSGSQYQTRLLF